MVRPDGHLAPHAVAERVDGEEVASDWLQADLAACIHRRLRMLLALELVVVVRPMVQVSVLRCGYSPEGG